MDVDIDIQNIIRKTESQILLVQFAYLFSIFINSDRLFKLSAEESKSINKFPVILAQQKKINKHKQK